MRIRRSKKSKKKERLFISILIAIAVILRLPMFWTSINGVIFPHIVTYSEATLIYFVQQPFFEMLRLTAIEGVPVIYPILLFIWEGVGPESIYWSVLLPFSANILSVYIFYRFAQKLIKVNTARLAALLLAVNPLHISYAADISPYSLLLVFTLLSHYFFWHYISQKKDRGVNGLWWVGMSLLAWHTHTFFIIVFALQILYLAWKYYRDARPSLGLSIKYILLIFLGLLPQMALFDRWTDIIGTTRSPLNIEPDITVSFLNYFTVILFGDAWYYESSYIVALISFFIIIGLFFLLLHKHKDLIFYYSQIMIFGTLLVFIFGNSATPEFFIVVTPFVALLAAHTIYDLKRLTRVLVVGFMIIGTLLGLSTTYAKPLITQHQYFGPFAYSFLQDSFLSTDLLIADQQSSVILQSYGFPKENIAVIFLRDNQNISFPAARFSNMPTSETDSSIEYILRSITGSRNRVWLAIHMNNNFLTPDAQRRTLNWFHAFFNPNEKFTFPENGKGESKFQLFLFER